VTTEPLIPDTPIREFLIIVFCAIAGPRLDLIICPPPIVLPPRVPLPIVALPPIAVVPGRTAPVEIIPLGGV
jgi:hypothetical protein